MSCEAGPDFSAARGAAEWVGLFYPDVTVTLDRSMAQLTSGERDEAALRLIWRTSLVNEKLLARGAGHRAAVIAAMVQ